MKENLVKQFVWIEPMFRLVWPGCKIQGIDVANGPGKAVSLCVQADLGEYNEERSITQDTERLRTELEQAFKGAMVAAGDGALTEGFRLELFIVTTPPWLA